MEAVVFFGLRERAFNRLFSPSVQTCLSTLLRAILAPKHAVRRGQALQVLLSPSIGIPIAGGGLPVEMPVLRADVSIEAGAHLKRHLP